MPLLDIFKKRKKPEKIEEKKKEERPTIEIKGERKPAEGPPAIQVGKEKPKEKQIKKKRKKISASVYQVLMSPHITEKATDLSAQNQYIFKVLPKTNKTEIKKAIEQIYGVDVDKVRIINIPKKPKKWGRATGWKKGHKKAIVKIKRGQKIEVIPR